MFGSLIRRTFHGYAVPEIVHPEWTVPYFVFQQGLPKTRDNSITGGGQIYGHEYEGTFQPLLLQYSTGMPSLTAGGQIVGLPPALMGLYGGNMGLGS